MRRRIGSMLLVLCMMAGVLMTGCGADNAEKKKGVETISPKGRMEGVKFSVSMGKNLL